MDPVPRGLVAFDLDGTLLRGRTVCEVIAAPLGRSAEMLQLEGLTLESEIAPARVAMAGWYRECAAGELLRSLPAATWAPGASEAVARLQRAGIEVAIASITWKFAVAWFAERLGVRHFLGTDLKPNGDVEHVWGADKATWIGGLAARLGIPANRVAAVGDSNNDAPLLGAAALRIFVGSVPPPDVPDLIHLPAADLRDVAERVLQLWGRDSTSTASPSATSPGSTTRM